MKVLRREVGPGHLPPKAAKEIWCQGGMQCLVGIYSCSGKRSLINALDVIGKGILQEGTATEQAPSSVWFYNPRNRLMLQRI